MNENKIKMKSSKVTSLRQIVNDARKEENKKYQYVANLYAISLNYPIQYPEALSSTENNIIKQLKADTKPS
jgi:hypothetical protein